jgi:hypothetical protein
VQARLAQVSTQPLCKGKRISFFGFNRQLGDVNHTHFKFWAFVQAYRMTYGYINVLRLIILLRVNCCNTKFCKEFGLKNLSLLLGSHSFFRNIILMAVCI